MSGFEIAGIVLGGIPILISALQQCKEGFTTIKNRRNYDTVLRRLIRNLKTEKANLDNVFYTLLKGLVSDDQIEPMIHNRSQKAWEDSGLRKGIKARLHTAFDLFEQHLEDIQTSLQNMTEKLEIQDGVVNSQSTSALIRVSKRIGFSWKKTEYDSILEAIKEGVSSLERLITPAIAEEPTRKLSGRRRSINILREVSGSVYRALKSNLRCGIACSHEVHLGLEAPSNFAYGEDDEAAIEKLLFWLAMTYKSDDDTLNTGFDPSMRLSWEELGIQATRPNILHPSLPLRNQPGTQQIHIKQRKKRHTIDQQDPNSAKLLVGLSSTATESLQTCVGSNCTCIDLCEKVRSNRNPSTPSYYGTIADHAFRKFDVLPKQTSKGERWTTVSLHEMMQDRNSPYMPYTARLDLATTISSSFLQLYLTPWLPENLTSRNILFLKRGSVLSIERAFVARSFPEGISKPVKTAPEDHTAALRSLGVLLLELNLWETLDSLRSKHEATARSECANKSEAMPKITDDIVMDGLMLKKDIWNGSYDSVVRRCLWGTLGREVDLSNEDFRQEIYTKVVSSLEADLGHATLRIRE